MKIKLRSEFNELVAETQNYSGREIETVVRRAKDYALDAGAKSGETVSVSAKDMKDACKSYKHNYDNDMYRLQTLLAIRVTNFRDFLPDVSTLPQGIVEGKDIDFEALQDEISKLQQRLRQAGRPV
jgi:SpoVK/Ycf46/Vps4 family AAA+-type ATPase